MVGVSISIPYDIYQHILDVQREEQRLGKCSFSTAASIVLQRGKAYFLMLEEQEKEQETLS